MSRRKSESVSRNDEKHSLHANLLNSATVENYHKTGTTPKTISLQSFKIGSPCLVLCSAPGRIIIKH